MTMDGFDDDQTTQKPSSFPQFDVDNDVLVALDQLPFFSAALSDSSHAFSAKRRKWGIMDQIKLHWTIQLRKEAQQHVRYKDLHLFMELPTELKLEVVQLLHPLDLYTLSATSRALRSLVVDGGSHVWRMAFSNSPEVLPVPEDVQPRMWARLLFGPVVCWRCGYERAPVDFILCRRLCEECKRKTCIAAYHLGDFEDEYKEYVFQMLPQSQYPWSLSQAPAVLKETYHSLLGDIRNAPSGMDEAAFSRWYAPYFKNVFKARLIEVGAKHAAAWTQAMQSELEKQAKNISSRLTKRFVKRATKNGYHWEDIRRSIGYIGYQSFEIFEGRHNSHLTQRRYRMILDDASLMIESARAERLQREREANSASKRTLVRFASEVYRKNAPLPLSLYWPSLPAILMLPGIREVMEAPDESVSPTVLVKVLTDEHTWYGWLDSVKERYSRYLDDALRIFHAKKPPRVDTLDLDHFHPPFEALDLAIAVFSFHQDQPYRKKTYAIGWEAVAAYDAEPTSIIECPLRGIEAAMRIVTLAGFDGSRITAKAMDQVHVRFACVACPSNRRGRLVFRWREAVEHDLTHIEPRWAVLSVAMTNYLVERERLLSAVFLCYHCNFNNCSLGKRADVRFHVRTTHNIIEPREGVDFRRHPKHDLLVHFTPKRVRLDAEYLCSHCRNAPLHLRRPLTRLAVGHHLCNKHGIKEPGPEDLIHTPAVKPL